MMRTASALCAVSMLLTAAGVRAGKGLTGKVYGPEEAVSIQEAIRMYTANPPYLTWEEKEKGTLEAGKLADLIVLDSDPLTISPEKLLTMNVDITVVGGKIVYQRQRSSSEVK